MQLCLVRAALRRLDLDDLPDADAAGILPSEMLHRTSHGHALRVKDGVLGQNGDTDLHARG